MDDGTLAGWHQDPSGRHELRFWDGYHWTEHVVDAGLPGLDHPTRSGRPPKEATPTPTPPLPGDEQLADLAAVTDESGGEPEPGPRPVATPPRQAHDEAAAEPPASEGEVIDLVRAETSSPAARDDTPGPVEEPRTTEPAAASAAPVDAPVAVDTAAGDAPEAAPDTPEESPPDPSHPPTPGHTVDAGTHAPRLVAQPPSVASPTGSSSGSNTSAIADPHRSPVAAPGEAGPRVAGVAPAPTKRYRPGSPPPSPHLPQRALAAVPAPVGTVVEPWYRRPAAWVAGMLVVALVAGSVLLVTQLVGGDRSDRLAGRPPAAAPRGTRIIPGNQDTAIAAPSDWSVSTDPGDSFAPLRRADWSAPVAAVAPNGAAGLLIVELRDLAHQPLVDPELFWADQVRSGVPTERTPVDSISVHGLPANHVTITGPRATIEAVAIDAGDRTFLVAFRGADAATADARYQQLIQTFDVR